MSRAPAAAETAVFDPQSAEELMAERCRRVVDEARGDGAEQAEAFGVRTRTISVQIEPFRSKQNAAPAYGAAP